MDQEQEADTQLNTLEKADRCELHRVFLEAFSDYIIKINSTQEQLFWRWRRCGVDLNLSSGAFHDGSLVGFIATGVGLWNGKQTAYNAGTGIIPRHRGKGMLKDLYEHLLPGFEAAEIDQCLLEVITLNERAVKAYSKQGFRINREFQCYKGEVQRPQAIPLPDGYRIASTSNINWKSAKDFCEIQPSWEFSQAAIERVKESYRFVEATYQEELVGFIAFDQKMNYLAQIAIHPKHRRKGLGTNLVREIIPENGTTITVLNVDSSHPGSKHFLTSLGIKALISQYEMIWSLS